MLGKRKWKESVNWQRSDEVNSVLQKVILKYKVIQVKKIRNIVKLLFTSLLHCKCTCNWLQTCTFTYVYTLLLFWRPASTFTWLLSQNVWIGYMNSFLPLSSISAVISFSHSFKLWIEMIVTQFNTNARSAVCTSSRLALSCIRYF